jgi:hypothetical protein
MTGGTGTKDIRTNYPCVDGITAETTTQTGHVTNLVPEHSVVPSRQRALLG